MLAVKVFNTLTRQKEDFKPITPGQINMYVCGPTVYNYIHIGNARSVIAFDTIRRYFEYKGYKVNYVSNFTDVDDKMINEAREEHTTVPKLADKYIRAYLEDTEALNIEKATLHPRATHEISEIIAFVEDLIKKGYAYEVDGDVYYRAKKFPNYGELSDQNIEQLEEGASEHINDEEQNRKEDPIDFALWKAQKEEDEIAWDSPWGKGRPGWHIECSVMSTKYLGDTIDIHGGGQDLEFPHHENEIAQSEMANGTKLANTWVHNGMINVGKDKVKMSKSLGNVILAKDLIDEFGGPACRWMMVSTHYRAPLTISQTVMENAVKELGKIEKPLRQALFQLCLADQYNPESKKDEASWKTFMDAMEDDLNTPNAISALQATVKELNQSLRKRDLDYTLLNELYASVTGMLSVLGIDLGITPPTEEQKQLYRDWKDAVRNKDFAKADECRASLMKLGLV